MYTRLFQFAAKAGSLEGYLYQRTKLDKLDDWVSNIVIMYHDLPKDIQSKTKDDLRVVVSRCLTYGASTLPANIKTTLEKLLEEL